MRNETGNYYLKQSSSLYIAGFISSVLEVPVPGGLLEPRAATYRPNESILGPLSDLDLFIYLHKGPTEPERNN